MICRELSVIEGFSLTSIPIFVSYIIMGSSYIRPRQHKEGEIAKGEKKNDSI